MNYKTYSEQLIVKLKGLVLSERKITAEIIELIKEVDQKRIYLQYGHTSMFAMLTKEFGYTPSAAMRRIDAARLSKELPEIKESLKSGELNLSQISMLAQSVRQKEKEQPTQKVHKSEKAALLEQVKSLDLVATQKALASSLDLKVQTYEKKTYQKDESVYMGITLSKELQKDLERVKELISHQNPNPTMAELIQFLAIHFLNRKDPLRPTKIKVDKNKLLSDSDKVDKTKQETNKHSSDCIERAYTATVPASRQKQVKRYVKSSKVSADKDSAMSDKNKSVLVKTRTEVFQRDQSCQWTTKKKLNGQIQTIKCGSRFQLQIDHIKPKWQDGDNKRENLQVLCATHNKLKYQYEILGLC